jgi:hypothetical protein
MSAIPKASSRFTTIGTSALRQKQISHDVFGSEAEIEFVDYILVTAAAPRPRPRSLPIPPAQPLDIYAART